MKVFFTGLPESGTMVDAVLEITTPSLADFVRSDREHCRSSMLEIAHTLFRSKNVRVRFSDECQHCFKLLNKETVGMTCANPHCPTSLIPVSALAPLMREIRHKPDETVESYMSRLRKVWVQRATETK